MQPNMPKTPFATNLSTSAKETELRIRNIFQWKKKRPPLVLFLLTAMLVLMCCSLVSCQAKETLPPMDGNLVDQGNANAPWNDFGDSLATYKEDFYTFLLLGCEEESSFVDTIMVAAYDVRANKINVISIPRDTRVEASRSVKKIGAAYGEGGIGQMVDEVSGLLGFCPDYYIKVDLQAFEDVVNILGGISYDVPRDMYYNDGAGFIIDLKAGQQMLDGEHALQLVRFRGYSNADFGRIQVQQDVLRELARKAVSLSAATKVEELVQVVYEHFETNLSIAELTYLGAQALFLDFSDDVTFATLPGGMKSTEDGWNYELDAAWTAAVVNDMVKPYTTNNAELADGQKLIVPSMDEIRENGYPVNSNGETYGGDVKEWSLRTPDLVLAQNGDGVLGYVRDEDLSGLEPSTPEEAVQYSQSQSKPRYVNMYLQDGETVIGTFYVG